MAMADSSRSVWYDDDYVEIDKLVQLFKEGKEKIQLDEHHRKLTLVLGVTGSGKSTLVQWLAGDSTKLISVKVPGSNSFAIKDATRISNSTEPMTIFPELVVDPETGRAYSDCPGFIVSHHPIIDIAGAHFVKSVADYAENVQLIFTIEQSGIMDRFHFLNMLTRAATKLVKNLDKFRKSIVLVVTKVENTVVGTDANGKPIYESDERIIESIANHLKMVREELIQGTIKIPNLKVDENSVKFIDVLLQRDDANQNYSKIALFRQPNMEGPLSEIPLMQKGKFKLLETVKQLELTRTEENDFGYTIQEYSMQVITVDASFLDNRMMSDALNITMGMLDIYAQFVNKIIMKIDTFVTTDESADANLTEAQTLTTKFKAADPANWEFSIQNVTRKKLIDKLHYIVTVFGIDTFRNKIEQISYKANNLEYLENALNLSFGRSPWAALVYASEKNISGPKEDLQTGVNTVAEKLTYMVNLTVSEIANEMLQAKLKQIQSQDIQQLPSQLDHYYSVMRNMTDELNKANTEELASAISKNMKLLDVETDLIKSKTLNISTRAKYLNYLQAFSDHPFNTGSLDWIGSFNQTAQSILDTFQWYLFLNDLYSKFSEYQFQKNLSRYNVANLDEWGQVQTHQGGIQIGEHNFKQFLDITSQYNIAGHDAIRDIKVTPWQLNELNQVLRLTLKHDKARLDCSETEKLTITGDYVKLSELKQKLVQECPGKVSSVNIFALETVFIDSDLNGVGDKLQFALIGSKLEVVGKRRINLNGSSGKLPIPPRAYNGRLEGDDGHVGKPGLAGGSSGSFLGVTERIVNRGDLTITANGGVGGAGQEGGNGMTGEDGVDAPEPDGKCAVSKDFHKSAKLYANDTANLAHVDYYEVRVHGKSAKDGGRGGDGGAGGKGGKPGQIKLFNLDESTEQQIETNHGNAGSGGLGGRGAFSGKHGDDIIAYCEHWTNAFGMDKWKRKDYHTGHNDTMRQAVSGKDGANVDGITEPEAATLILHPGDIINDYKKFLRGNLDGVNDRFKRNTTIALIDKINGSPMYGSLPLAGELGRLGERSQILRNKHDSSNSYHSLVDQISKYAEVLQPTGNLDQFTKMLSNLSTVDKLYNLNSFLKPNLTYNVDGFLYYAQKMINILNKLRNQQQHEIAQQQLANLIVNSNSTRFTSSTDPQLLSVAKELEPLIRSNFVLQQYDSLIVVLKKVVFPYAHFYLDEAGFNRNSTDIEYLIDNAVASLDKIRLKVNENRSSVWRVDRYARETSFDSTHSLTSPFFVWTNGENRNAIEKLLSGESIALNADIRLSDSNKDAIKFSLIEINLKAKNSTAQAELDAKLKHFSITARHMGNSHYRYNQKYYLIKNAPLPIGYSFEKLPDGFPVLYNDVYKKIRTAGQMHSPYAMWQFKLTKDINTKVSFDQLAMYRDDVDLELVGQGIYTDSEQARSDYFLVDRYYSEYRTRAQSNVTESQQLNSAKVMKVSNSLHRSSDRVIDQASNSTGALSYMSRLGETVSNLFGNSNSTVNTHIDHSRFDYTNEHNNTNTNLTAASNSFDVHGNLLMSQLLVGLITGKNSTITNESYISPEQTRAVQVESLAQRIAPALSQSNGTRSSQLYNSNNQWHRDLMSENVTSREHN